MRDLNPSPVSDGEPSYAGDLDTLDRDGPPSRRSPGDVPAEYPPTPDAPEIDPPTDPDPPIDSQYRAWCGWLVI